MAKIRDKNYLKSVSNVSSMKKYKWKRLSKLTIFNTITNIVILVILLEPWKWQFIKQLLNLIGLE